MPSLLRIAVLMLAAWVFSAAAFAHSPDTAHTHGWLDGALHPLNGLDHLAAMLGVGVLAAHRGGVGMWLIPTGFIAGMAAGFLPDLPAPPVAVEAGTILSLVVLGAVLAPATDLPARAVAAIAVAAGLSHGAAHAAEIPAGSGFADFAAGALVMTAILHAVGGAAGAGLRGRRLAIGRATGLALAGLGLGLAVQAI